MSNDQHLKEKGLKYPCTDIGNSERFIAQHGDALRYVPEEKSGRRWIAYDGTRWSAEQAKPLKRAKLTAKSIWDEAKECENTQGQSELGKWAHKSEFEHRLRPMLKLAEESLSTSISAFDTDLRTLNCKNGIVNLETGELVKHSPDQLVMKRAEADYLPTAKADTWGGFLDQIFLGDKDLIAYVQRALGYTLTGLINEHSLFIAYGLGANGKTTLFETILEILGDYGTTTEFGTFLNTDKRDVRIQEAVGKLKGVRFAVASETDSTRKWNESLVKKLTGGDTLTGAKLHGDSYEFKPTHKLWFQANHLPGFKDASHGLLRRLKVIPFRAKFEGSGIDPKLRDKLRRERNGILAWLVEGARLYLRDGLGDAPDAVTKATQEYINDNDALGRFMAECMEQVPGATAGSNETYRAWEAWCTQAKEDPGAEKFFAKAMAERGIEKKRRNTGSVFLGLKLKASPSSAQAVNDNTNGHRAAMPSRWEDQTEEDTAKAIAWLDQRKTRFQPF